MGKEPGISALRILRDPMSETLTRVEPTGDTSRDQAQAWVREHWYSWSWQQLPCWALPSGLTS